MGEKIKTIVEFVTNWVTGTTKGLVAKDIKSLKFAADYDLSLKKLNKSAGHDVPIGMKDLKRSLVSTGSQLLTGGRILSRQKGLFGAVNNKVLEGRDAYNFVRSSMKGFNFEMLSVMFFAQGVSKALKGLFSEAFKAAGIFNIMSTIMKLLFLPVALALIGPLLFILRIPAQRCQELDVRLR